MQLPKICSKCEIEKEISEFYKRKKKNGQIIDACCKSCYSNSGRKYRDINKNNLKDRKRKYYLSIKDSKKYKEKVKKYRIENKQNSKKYHKEYREKNIDKLKIYIKEYYTENKAKIVEGVVKNRIERKKKDPLLLYLNIMNLHSYPLVVSSLKYFFQITTTIITINKQ